MADIIDDKTLEKLYLTELESLELFRIAYRERFQNAPLEREDPDIRRLIEALAFFSARTRQVSERAVNESLLQLFRQFFPYATSPLPAMALLRADVKSMAEAVSLPRGLELRASSTGAPTSGHSHPYHFRTLTRLDVLPLRLVNVRRVPGAGHLHRIILEFSADRSSQASFDEITLLVNHLGDLQASLVVFFALKKRLRATSVIWSHNVSDQATGQTCQTLFGPPPSAPHEFDAFESPVERFRLFLHFPQAELFLRFTKIPKPSGAWQHFSICLDVEDWPLTLSLTRNSFSLNVAPMANLRRDTADIITHDATVDRHLIHHPDDDAGFVPHSLLGVYNLNGKHMEPVEPGILGPTRLGYESVFEGKGPGRRAWLLLELPGSFEEPKRIAVDAAWTQPDILGLDTSDLRFTAVNRHVEKVTWSCEGGIVQPADSEVEDHRDELLALTGLKGKRLLSNDDLTFLLRVLGAQRRPEFKRVQGALSSVTHTSRPAAGNTGGVSQVYTITFKNLGSLDLPALHLLCVHLLRLLQSWSIEQIVEIITLVPELSHTERFTS